MQNSQVIREGTDITSRCPPCNGGCKMKLPKESSKPDQPIDRRDSYRSKNLSSREGRKQSRIVPFILFRGDPQNLYLGLVPLHAGYREHP
jgi:hypothetical protein